MQFHCPVCKSEMIERRTRDNRIFLGCIKFPKCKGTRETDGRVGSEIKSITTLTEQQCSDCGAPLVFRSGWSKRAKRTYSFLGCSRYPACKHTENVQQAPVIVAPVPKPDPITTMVVKAYASPTGYLELPAHNPAPAPMVEVKPAVATSAPAPVVMSVVTPAPVIVKGGTIEFDTDRLGAAIKLAAKVTTRSYKSILESIRLHLTGRHTLTLTATDLDHWLSLDVSGYGNDAAMDILVPAAQLARLPLPKKGEITLAQETEGEVTRLLISYPGFTRTLAGILPTQEDRDLLSGPDMHHDYGQDCWLPMDKEVRDRIKWVSQATSDDDARPNLCGVLIKATNLCSTQIVATDGHRLHKATLPGWTTTDLDNDGFGERNCILRSKTVDLLLAMPGDQRIVARHDKGDFLRIVSDDCRIYARLIDGRFPDFKRVIPAEFKTSANVYVKELAIALKNLTFTQKSKDTTAVKLRLNGDLRLERKDVDGNIFTGQADAWGKNGPDATVSLNLAYLKQATTTMGSVKVQMGDDLYPTLWTDADHDYSALIMPVRF